MKVCGFTFIRNAEKFDFPVVEAITSVLPLCDRFIVAVGESEDNTRQMIEKIDPAKIRILDTVWDETLCRGGAVYAAETNKAFDAVPPEYDWCFYIQGDEVVHEKFLPAVQQAMHENLADGNVEGLLFGYRHFYGTYDYVGDSRKWYRNEIRIIRNDKSIRSYRDAQGFRKNNRKLKVAPAGAEIYHYGWVRTPAFMQKKIRAVRQFYEGGAGNGSKKEEAEKDIFDYGTRYDALAKFEGTHPAVMHDRIQRMNWRVTVDPGKIRMKPKYRILHAIEKRFGIRLFEYRNYSLLKYNSKQKILNIRLMEINRLAFGSISIDGKTYEKDVIIDNGTVEKRKKGPSKKYRGMFGHTPLSSGENIPWNCKFLVIGDGHSSSLPVMDEVYEVAREKNVRLLVMSTPEAIKHINDPDTNFILHLTC